MIASGGSLSLYGAAARLRPRSGRIRRSFGLAGCESGVRAARHDPAPVQAAADADTDGLDGQLDCALLTAQDINQLPALRLDGVLAYGERAIIELVSAGARATKRRSA